MKTVFLALALLSIIAFLSTIACTNVRSLSSNAFCQSVSANYVLIGSAAIHAGLISAALFFIWQKNLKTTLKKMGFTGDARSNLKYTAICLAAMFAILLVLGVAAYFLGVDDQQKVTDKISALPLYMLVFAVLIAPFTEELFFRALLVPRLGIVLSAVLFSVSHVAYGSVVEIAGVFVVGLILGSVFRMSKSIIPCILAHIAYNLLSIMVMRLLV